MKINADIIKKIFNLEIKFKKSKDKIALSKYEDQVPMYDIYSQRVYPINKQNIHYRLIESHYRFIDKEIYQWLKNLYDKYANDDVKGPRFKYNLDVIDNYQIDILIETCYKTLYKYSPLLGLQVSICKRNSFHPFVQHLKPYYTKLELIKLGQNMDIIKTNIDPEYLIDQKSHYNMCKKVSKNDVSFELIQKHHQYIINNNGIGWVCFYSFVGSFLFNKYLRNSKMIASNYYQGLYKLVQLMENSPPLENDYLIYRFIWDDSFISSLKEGDTFVDKGFISTTRDPFYSPGLNGNFGLILLKIKIPKNKKGVGLFIENFSLFPKEEEFLLPPLTKLRLKSKNDNFKYYHTNPEFEKLINRKYEFELVSADYKSFYLEHKKVLNILEKPELYQPIDKINLVGIDRVNIIKQFIQSYSVDNLIKLSLDKDVYTFNYLWFDSSLTSSYEKFYYNKVKDGVLFSLVDVNGNPYLNIELGTDLVVNYLNKFYSSNDNISLYLVQPIVDLIYHFGRVFHYKNALLMHQNMSFSIFKTNYKESNYSFLYQNLFNYSIYSYLKSNTKFDKLNDSFISYDIGYWYLDEYFNKKPEQELIDKLPAFASKASTYKELFIEICERYFYLYPKLVESMDINIFKKSYYTLSIYDKLASNGLVDNFKPNIDHAPDTIGDDDFKLIFRQPIRRI